MDSNVEESLYIEQNLSPKLLSEREQLVAGGSQPGVKAHCGCSPGGTLCYPGETLCSVLWWDTDSTVLQWWCDTQTKEVQDCQLSTGPLFDCQLIHFLQPSD